jgi:omega-6 fatty acid desaturase (delta-12 desaturase)
MNVRVLREHLTELRSRSLAGGVLDFVLSVAVYAAAFLGALHVSWPPIRFVLGLVAGVASGSLFMMGHDACHGSYTSHQGLNRILGRIAFLPSYHTYSPNRIHHIYTNLRGKDFVWAPLSKTEFDALPAHRRALYRMQRNLLGLALYYPIEIWWPRLFFPRRAHLDRPRAIYTLDSLLVLAFMVAQAAIVFFATRKEGWAGLWWGASYALLLPYAVFSWMIGFVIYFNHTHPDVPWFGKKEEWSAFTGMIDGTVRLLFPRWTLFFASNIMDHVAHHVDPRIPLVRLREAQDRIQELVPGRVVVVEWSVAALLDIVRRCKLYDYEAYRWIDYDGNPTSEPRPPRAPERDDQPLKISRQRRNSVQTSGMIA